MTTLVNNKCKFLNLLLQQKVSGNRFWLVCEILPVSKSLRRIEQWTAFEQ